MSTRRKSMSMPEVPLWNINEITEWNLFIIYSLMWNMGNFSAASSVRLCVAQVALGGPFVCRSPRTARISIVNTPNVSTNRWKRQHLYRRTTWNARCAENGPLSSGTTARPTQPNKPKPNQMRLSPFRCETNARWRFSLRRCGYEL